jgi:membrane dipeptidase
MLIVDAHLDLSYNAVRGRDVERPATEQKADEQGVPSVGLPDLAAGGVGPVCATIWCEPVTEHTPNGYRTADEATAQAQRQFDWYRRQSDRQAMRMVKTRADLPQSQSPPSQIPGARSPVGDPLFSILHPPPSAGHPPSPLAFLLLLEGADALGGPAELAQWHDRGLRIVGLAWHRTRFAGGTGEPGPLTPEGRAMVDAMERLGMIHDLSHLAEESLWELLDLGGRRVMASHSNCRAIVPGDRQLADKAIRAIAARGGVVGINFFSPFLSAAAQRTGRAKLSDVVAHFRHVCDLCGDARHVGLGTDMDGGFGRDKLPEHIDSPRDLARVAEALSASGFGDEDVANMMGGNWLEFFGRSLPQ